MEKPGAKVPDQALEDREIRQHRGWSTSRGEFLTLLASTFITLYLVDRAPRPRFEAVMTTVALWLAGGTALLVLTLAAWAAASRREQRRQNGFGRPKPHPTSLRTTHDMRSDIEVG